MTIELIEIAAGILFILQFLKIKQLSKQVANMTERINALADESKRTMSTLRTDVTIIAKNAQGIASNALSSAQRAESKVEKMSLQKLMEKDLGTVKIEEKNA